MVVKNNSIIYETCIDESLTFFNEKVSFNPIELIKRVFGWIINQVNKAIKFIKNKLKNKKTENNSNNAVYALKEPYDKNKRKRSTKVNDNGPIKSNGTNKFALDAPFRKTKNEVNKRNKAKEINIDEPIELGTNKIAGNPRNVKVDFTFVKKCYIYGNSLNTKNEFFDDIDIEEIISSIKNNKNIDKLEQRQFYSFISLKRFLESIKNSKYWICSNYNNERLNFKNDNNKNFSIKIRVHDILKIVEDFKKDIKKNESELINATNRLISDNKNKNDENRIKKEVYNFINNYKYHTSYFIHTITQVADFDLISAIKNNL